MLATPLRKNVDDLWNRVWSSGVTNPLAVVDYLTGLLLPCPFPGKELAGGCAVRGRQRQ